MDFTHSWPSYSNHLNSKETLERMDNFYKILGWIISENLQDWRVICLRYGRNPDQIVASFTPTKSHLKMTKYQWDDWNVKGYIYNYAARMTKENPDLPMIRTLAATLCLHWHTHKAEENWENQSEILTSSHLSSPGNTRLVLWTLRVRGKISSRKSKHRQVPKWFSQIIFPET